MSVFNKAVVTEKGQALLAKSVAGLCELQFTKIALSEATLPADVSTVDSIGEIKQASPIANKEMKDNVTVAFEATFVNTELTTGYRIRNIGLYAMDPDEGEILYSVSVAEESEVSAGWMPPYDGMFIKSLLIELVTAVSNAPSVKVVVDPTVFATVNQVTKMLNDAKRSGEFDGEDGRGIKSITRTGGNGSAGTVDTYTVTYTDDTKSTFTVYNGKNGADGKDYILTENDKNEIITNVYDLIKNGGVVGFVDANNNIVISGNLADGTYNIKYEMEDGSKVNIGNLVLDNNIYYSVTKDLTSCTIDNSCTTIIEGESYSATISANSGYELSSVRVTMGGTDITSSVVSGGNISIASVTGNIIITAVAEESAPKGNLVDPTSSDWQDGYRLSISSGTTSKLDGHTTTNFIPCKAGDVLRVKGLTIIEPATDGGDSESPKIVRYNANKSKLGGAYGTQMTNSNQAYGKQVVVDGDISTYTIAIFNDGTQSAETSCAFIRIDGFLIDGYTKNDVIITINEDIV